MRLNSSQDELLGLYYYGLVNYSKVSEETSLDYGERMSLTGQDHSERVSLSSIAEEKASLNSATEVTVEDLIDMSSDPGTLIRKSYLTFLPGSQDYCVC